MKYTPVADKCINDSERFEDARLRPYEEGEQVLVTVSLTLDSQSLGTLFRLRKDKETY